MLLCICSSRSSCAPSLPTIPSPPAAVNPPSVQLLACAWAFLNLWIARLVAVMEYIVKPAKTRTGIANISVRDHAGPPTLDIGMGHRRILTGNVGPTAHHRVTPQNGVTDRRLGVVAMNPAPARPRLILHDRAMTDHRMTCEKCDAPAGERFVARDETAPDIGMAVLEAIDSASRIRRRIADDFTTIEQRQTPFQIKAPAAELAEDRR